MKYALLMLFTLCGCVEDADIVRAVEKQGYTDVRVDDWSWAVEWNGCSDSDAIAYDMTAINPLGERVSLVACTGRFMKGVTIRTR